jgi:hypothetical protein
MSLHDTRRWLSLRNNVRAATLKTPVTRFLSKYSMISIFIIIFIYFYYSLAYTQLLQYIYLFSFIYRQCFILSLALVVSSLVTLPRNQLDTTRYFIPLDT